MGTFLQSSITTVEVLFQSCSQLSTWLIQRSLGIYVLMYLPTVVLITLFIFKFIIIGRWARFKGLV